MSKVSNKVYVDSKVLAQLEKNSRILEALEANGVDNWDGYSDALSEILANAEVDEPAGRGAGIVLVMMKLRCVQCSPNIKRFGARWSIDYAYKI